MNALSKINSTKIQGLKTILESIVIFHCQYVKHNQKLFSVVRPEIKALKNHANSKIAKNIVNVFHVLQYYQEFS